MTAEEIDEGLKASAFAQFPTDLIERRDHPLVPTHDQTDGCQKLQHQCLGPSDKADKAILRAECCGSNEVTTVCHTQFKERQTMPVSQFL